MENRKNEIDFFPKKKFGVKKSKFANRLKHALPKFRGDRSQARGVNGRSKFRSSVHPSSVGPSVVRAAKNLKSVRRRYDSAFILVAEQALIKTRTSLHCFYKQDRICELEQQEPKWLLIHFSVTGCCDIDFHFTSFRFDLPRHDHSRNSSSISSNSKSTEILSQMSEGSQNFFSHQQGETHEDLSS